MGSEILNKTVYPKKIYDFTFKWIVEDFDVRYAALTKRGETFASSAFYDQQKNFIWNLVFEPSHMGGCLMNLMMDSDKFGKNMYGVCKFIFYDKINQIDLLAPTIRTFGSEEYVTSVILDDAILPLFDVLAVKVSIKIFDTKLKGYDPTYELDAEKFTFYKYVSSLYNSKKLADITINSNGKNFPAHKIVLAAHSPVFDTMFGESWQTSSQDTINMTDFEAGTIEKFLQFIYQQCSLESEPFNTLSELYQLADKYDIEILKDICKNYLLKNVDNSSALHLLWLGERYSNDNMKQAATDYIRANPSSLSNISKCMYLTLKEPKIIEDIEAGKFLL